MTQTQITTGVPMLHIPPVTPESIAAAKQACEEERRRNGIIVGRDERVIVAPRQVILMPLPLTPALQELDVALDVQDELDALIEKYGLARVKHAVQMVEAANDEAY